MKNMVDNLKAITESQKRMAIGEVECIREKIKKATERDDIMAEAQFIACYARELEDAVRRVRELDEKLLMLNMITEEDN